MFCVWLSHNIYCNICLSYATFTATFTASPHNRDYDAFLFWLDRDRAMHAFWDEAGLPKLPPHPLARLQPAAFPGALLACPLGPWVRVLRPAQGGYYGDGQGGAAGAMTEAAGGLGCGEGDNGQLAVVPEPKEPEPEPVPELHLLAVGPTLQRQASAIQFDELDDSVEAVSRRTI